LIRKKKGLFFVGNDHQPQSAEQGQQESGARLLLILGGARSGKSTFAEKLALQSGQSVALIATATAEDEEMHARIVRHQAARPSSWQTIEEPLDLSGAVRRASELANVMLLDCLTLWTSNWLLRQTAGLDADMVASDQLFGAEALQEIEKLLETLRTLPASKTLLAISNEVGLGIVPAYALGRVYRDTLGYINQRLASAAERVYLLVAGIAVDVKRLQEEASLFS
jgi:adenosylcobinamide kinase / adenosylcobinamide-phosphate guanylyltransferase